MNSLGSDSSFPEDCEDHGCVHSFVLPMSADSMTVLDSAAGLPCAAAGFSNVTQVRLGPSVLGQCVCSLPPGP